MTLGIKASKYEHLLFTEANSEPRSEFWIAEMSKRISETKTINLGYANYKKEGSLFNVFIRFVNLISAIQCFSFAKSGSPFMGFKANLLYKKTDFFNVKGFINHMKIKNGETDLFIKDAAIKKNTTFTISKNSIVEVDTPKSFKNWFLKLQEKTILKKNYKPKHRFLLHFFTFSKFIINEEIV